MMNPPSGSLNELDMSLMSTEEILYELDSLRWRISPAILAVAFRRKDFCDSVPRLMLDKHLDIHLHARDVVEMAAQVAGVKVWWLPARPYSTCDWYRISGMRNDL